MRLATKVSAAMAGVAAGTAVLALPAAIIYTEHRLEGLPEPLRATVERQIEINAWDDFDGMLELLAVVGIAATAATTVGAVIARRIARPVREVGDAAHRVAAGELTARAPVRRRRDELGHLVTDFNSMADALEALDRDRTVATAAIAHELRSPLTVLAARLQAVDDGLLVVDADEVRRLRRQVDALTWLVDDLRTLSLGTAGRLVPDVQPVDVAALVDTVVVDVALEDRPVRIDVDSAPGSEPVLADPVLLERAIGNVVDNAVRHAAERGVVTVDVSPRGEHLAIAVTNDGDPIDDDVRDRLFEPFYRSDASRSRRSGSGLGLTVVQMIVVAHGGQVEVDNTPTGPRFTLLLPLGSPTA